MSFIGELKRRNVFRMAVLYVVAAWLILQVTDVVAGLANLPDWVGPGVIGLLFVGFPIALILSWFYEITPQGISLEQDVDRTRSITQITGRRLDLLVISLLAAAVLLFAYDKWSVRGPPGQSIAVLPFTNLSNDPDQEYFSDGISEELLNVLSKIPDLHVSARTSSFQFKGENRDIIDIGRQLNTGLIVEGSVRKAGPQVRIAAQLVDARNGFHLWSETYDRKLENIFALQDEISAAIVASLREHLGLRVDAAPRIVAAANNEAHEAYLRGRYLVTRGGVAIQEAIQEFELALSHDPDYALAHAELAIAHLDRSRNLAEGIVLALPHAERALALQPTLAQAHAAQGYLAWAQENWEEALVLFRRAVQFNPNYVDAYVWMGNLLSWKLGRYDEAFKMRETAMRLDPLSIPTIVFYLQALIERNRIAEAQRELEKIASIYPHVYAYRKGSIESRGGKSANAILGSLEALRINPEYSQVKLGMTFRFAELGLYEEIFRITEHPLPAVLILMGNPQEAVSLAQARLARDPESVIARHDLGLALAGAGDYSSARPILEEMWRLSGGKISKRSDVFPTLSAVALIAIRRAAGDESGTGELIAAIRDNVQRYRKAGIVTDGRSYSVDFEEGLALYLSGDRKSGIAHLDKGTEDGVFVPPNQAYLRALYEDPAFAPILARQEARQARERERFLAIVCNDNPYDAIWQPAVGTCAQLSTSGGN